MIPPHTHTREDECDFVLEGELTFDVGGEIAVAPAGSFVVKPRGVYHALCNASTQGLARVLEFHTPGEFEDYYDEYERIVQSDMDEDERLKARTELGERYGVVWHDELIPEAFVPLGHRPLGAQQSADSVPFLLPYSPEECVEGVFREVR